MFGNKKSKIEEPMTPEELSKYNDKQTADPVIEHFHVQTDSTKIVQYNKRQKVLKIIISIILIILILLFLVSLLVTQWGDLVISVDSPAVKKGIVLSEDPEFKTMSATLSANQQNNVTNITYSWLPKDLDTAKDGEHNGKNYVAYTFYVKNNGQVTLDYTGTLEITGVAKSADEAARVQVYKNGEAEIFGKGKYTDRNTAETDCTKFIDDKKVMTTETTGFEVDQIDKYTIIIWIEGNDPEAVDEIRNGHVRMQMLFEVDTDEEENNGFFSSWFKK